MSGSSEGSNDRGNGGNKRRRGGSGNGGNARGSGASQHHKKGARPAKGAPRSSGGQHSQPIEVVVRSTRNALKRHAEQRRDDQSKLACRGLLIALHGNMEQVSNPGELLGVVEQIQHVLQSARPDFTQLPVAIRAVVVFATETPARQRDIQEMVRLLLRHLYVRAADDLPRQARDDGRFRASALLDVLEQVAREYLDDESFARLQRPS